MTKKRFKEQNLENHLNRIYDTTKGEVVFDENIVDLLNELHKKNIQLENKLKFLYELNKPYGAIIEENIRLKTFIKRLTNNCGEIILMNGMGYNVNKILGDLE